jgi:rRNA maturation RNase YbeY
MKLLLQNRQTEARARIPAIRKLLRWLIAHSSKLRQLDPWSEIVLILTNDAGITPVNRATFGKVEPTDVISLTYRGMPGEPATSAGEIFVNAERARVIGRDTRKTGRELALYIAHGLHHLAGASDRTPALRRAMLNEEKAWLAKAREAGLLKELVRL